MRPTDDRLFDTFDPPLLLDLGEVPGVTGPAPEQPKSKTTKLSRQPLFEIGVVYRKGSRMFLAVSDRMLITLDRGELQELRPTTRYDAVRSISVQELCGVWKITLERLDETVLQYLAPSQECVKTRPRGSRRQRAADELKWRARRTVRLLAG